MFRVCLGYKNCYTYQYVMYVLFKDVHHKLILQYTVHVMIILILKLCLIICKVYVDKNTS